MTIARELVSPIPQSLANPTTGAEPIDELNGLALYVEVSVGEGAVAGEIDTWKDISAKVNNCVQTVAADKPSTDGTVNGRTAYRFLGGDHLDVNDDPFSLDSLHFIFGCVLDAGTNSFKRFMGNEGATSGWFIGTSGVATFRYGTRPNGVAANNVNGTADARDPTIFVGTFDPSTGQKLFWANGGPPDIDATTASHINPDLTGDRSSVGSTSAAPTNAADADYLAFAFAKGLQVYGPREVNLLGEILSDISKLPWTTATL